jgi:hypothetical protein
MQVVVCTKSGDALQDSDAGNTPVEQKIENTDSVETP